MIISETNLEHLDLTTCIIPNRSFQSPVFRQILFKNTVEFHFGDEIDKPYTLYFFNCIFLNNIEFGSNYNKSNYSSIKLIFINCEFRNKNEDFYNAINIKTVSLVFKNCVFDSLIFSNSNFLFLRLINCFFRDRKFIFSNNEIRNLTLTNVIGNVSIENCNKTYLDIRFSNQINIYAKRLKVLNKMKIKDLLQQPTRYYLRNIKSIRLHTSFGPTNQISLPIWKRIIESNRKNNSKPRGISSESYLFPSEFINKTNISVQIINETSLKNENIDISGMHLNELTLFGQFESKVAVHNVKCNKFEINTLQCKDLSIYRLKPRTQTSIINILDSNLNGVIFDQIKFHDFNNVNIYKSTVESVRFIASSLPDEITAYKLDNLNQQIEDEYYYDHVAENYKQIKQSLLNSNDLEKAYSMHEKYYNSLEKSKSLSWQDRNILRLNRWSNSHGTSPIRALKLAVLSSLFLYIFYCLLLPSTPYKLGFESWSSLITATKNTFSFIWAEFKSFWILLNPGHKIGSLENLQKGEGLSSGNYFISWFSRIILAWLFVQFVLAFRKFGRKL